MYVFFFSFFSRCPTPLHRLCTSEEEEKGVLPSAAVALQVTAAAAAVQLVAVLAMERV
jgi:hypothetical protein